MSSRRRYEAFFVSPDVDPDEAVTAVRKVSMRSLRYGTGISKPLALDVPFRLERESRCCQE
jgi:hypothetical protein